MRRVLNLAFTAAGHAAALFVLAIFLLMVLAAAGRLAEWPVGAVNDVVSWCCAAAAFLAMPDAFKNGDFVRVTLVLDRLPAALKRRLEVVALTIAAVAVGYLAWWAGAYTLESWEFNDMATGMVALPMWIPQLSLVVGAGLFALAVLDELWLVLQGHKPTYVRLVEERHAKGDFSSDL